MPGTLPPEGPPGSASARTADAAAPPEPAPPSSRGADATVPLVELSSSALVDDEVPAAPPTSLIGSHISSRYRIDELIGQGGMGAVYRGEQIHLRKRVAIKVLRQNVERVPELAARFEREAIAGAHVAHPNVAAAIDFGKLDESSSFLVLEYVDGAPLSTLLAEAPLPVARALAIARQIASALEAVHAKGIVHRDVKPRNVLLDGRDHVKLIDFGLAKVRLDLLSDAGRVGTQPGAKLTAAGVVFGTLAYLAPEASLGMDAIDARADLYALGVILYEMLCGKRPFEGKDDISLFRHQRLERPPPIRARAPDVSIPAEVESIAMRLLEPDPANRYATAAEVIAAIDAALATRASRVPERAPRAGESSLSVFLSRTRTSFSPWVVASVAIGSLALGATLVVLFAGPSHPSGATQASASAPPAAPSVGPEPADSSSTLADGDGDGQSAAVWHARLKKAVSIKDWALGAKAVLALVDVDPISLGEGGARNDVVAVAAGVGFEGDSDRANQVFDALTNRLGSDGLDILFEVVRSRGGTKAGKRAAEILTRPDVVARETPALRIAVDLRNASCGAKRSLFDRAATEGDGRVLFELEIARDAPCSSKKDPCCFREDKDIADAIRRLKARL